MNSIKNVNSDEISGQEEDKSSDDYYRKIFDEYVCGFKEKAKIREKELEKVKDQEIS